MVLGNLMGEGDPEFAKRVAKPIKPQNVMYAGLYDMATPSQLADDSEPVLDWLRSTKAKHVAIHFDLDVIDPSQFRSPSFTMPNIAPDAFAGVARGRMTIPQVIRLLNDVANHVEVVTLGITEHLRWDALIIRDMLRQLPLVGKSRASEECGACSACHAEAGSRRPGSR